MQVEAIFCSDCQVKMKILENLAVAERGMKTSHLKRTLGRSKGWSYLTNNILPQLEENGLVERSPIKDKGNPFLWKITGKGQNLLKTLKDPPVQSFKIYVAGAETALKVLRKLPFAVPFLLSAGLYWRNTGFQLTENLNFASELFVDSGAQQFYKKIRLKDYPYTAREYIHFCASVEADLIATLDLPLDILVPDGRLTVKEGLETTVFHGVEVFAEAEKLQLQSRVVPVLQGYDDPVQWLECLDMYKEHGIDCTIWGIGSLCMMKSSKLATNVLNTIRNALGKTKKIHVFGLALNTLREVYHLIDSSDTSVWIYWAKKDGACFQWDPLNRRFIQLQARDGKRYETLSIMALNVRAIFQMAEDINLWFNCKQAQG